MPGETEFTLGELQSGIPTNVRYASPENPIQRAPIKTTYTNFQDLFDTNRDARDGIQLDSNNLINKDWLESKYYELIRLGNLGYNKEHLKYLKNLGKAALNYQKYFENGNPRLGVNPKKVYNAQKEFDRASKVVLDWTQSLKQKRYKIDENGNPILVYEGTKDFDKDSYDTAEKAKAAYNQQQQYNKDARSWAGRNYMEKKDWDALEYDPATGFKDHDAVIDHLVSLAGNNVSQETIDKAKKGGIWGNASNQIFQAALDNVAKTDYREARALYNSIRNKYSNTGPFRFEKGATLYDGSNAFTGANTRNWLESEAGVNDVNQFYKTYHGDPGYMDDYQDYVKKQKEVADWQKKNGGFGASYSTQFKQGGKMNKYQQGGQAPTAAQMVLQALSAAQQGDQSGLQQLFSDKKTAQAVIQQLQKEAQEGSEEAIQALEALKQIMSKSKKQATMAQKGAKLSYIHRLATGCPPGMEMTYFKRGGRLCKACIEKAKKAKEGASLDNIIAKNKRRYPGITDDQAAGRAPIRKNGKDYYLGGDGVLSEAPKRSKYGFGGFFEYFKCGGKPKKPKCGTKAKCGAELEKCGGKTPMDKCGGKTPMTKCGGKAPMDKCGGKTTVAKCGAELKKCGGKAKKSSPKKPVVNKDKCGGKAKKHAIGGNLELLKYMILNYNK